MSEVVYNKGNTFSEATEFTYYPAIVELEDGFKVGALFTSAQMRLLRYTQNERGV